MRSIRSFAIAALATVLSSGSLPSQQARNDGGGEVRIGPTRTFVRGDVLTVEEAPQQATPLEDGNLTAAMARLAQALRSGPERIEITAQTPAGERAQAGERTQAGERAGATSPQLDGDDNSGDRGFFARLFGGGDEDEAQTEPQADTAPAHSGGADGQADVLLLPDARPSSNIDAGEIVDIDREHGFAVVWLTSRLALLGQPVFTRSADMQRTAILSPQGHRVGRAAALDIRWGEPRIGEEVVIPGEAAATWVEGRLGGLQPGATATQ